MASLRLPVVITESQNAAESSKWFWPMIHDFVDSFLSLLCKKKKRIMSMQYLSHKGSKPIEKSAFSVGEEKL